MKYVHFFNLRYFVKLLHKVKYNFDDIYQAKMLQLLSSLYVRD